MATGQDWRAVEAGAHAYAARDGSYTALSRWRCTDSGLLGELTLPLAVGTCLVLLLALLAFVHSAMGHERRLIRIIDRLEEKDPGG